MIFVLLDDENMERKGGDFADVRDITLANGWVGGGSFLFLHYFSLLELRRIPTTQGRKSRLGKF